jgi:hypothetical protein
VLAILSLFVFRQLGNLALEDIFHEYSAGAEMAFEGILSFVILFLVTILIGVLFPIVSSLYTGEQNQNIGKKSPASLQ